MGSALRNYKSGCRSNKLPDVGGGGGGGAGLLTDKVIDKIPTYYGHAIRNNEGIENIRRAIWAIYYHTISCPSEETMHIQHSYSPDAPDTWCKYKLDIINGTDVYSTSVSR